MINIPMTSMKNFIKVCLFLYFASQLSACSISQMTIRAAMPLVDGGFTSMQMETDLDFAFLAIPANISLVEGMLIKDPDNEKLHIYAAQAYYGYAFGFVEDGYHHPKDTERASRLYLRCLKHSESVLMENGLDKTIYDTRLKNLQTTIEKFDKDDVPALFWSASCLAKYIDLNRDKAVNLAQLSKAVLLMQRVLDLDENYYMSSANIFFGVYYGSKSPMLGGNFDLSEQHFAKAAEFNNNKLLIVDLLKAQYLERQRFNRQEFQALLNHIIQADNMLYPEQALINQIAKHKAALLIKKEDEWF